MKIIEGMKELRIIEKKMLRNHGDITKYASLLSTERPLFETEDAQKKEVKSLIQSNQDLMDNYLDLKQNLEYTNLMTKVEMSGKEYSISELLVLKRKLAKQMMETYSSLNDTVARNSLVRRPASKDEKTPEVLRLYREEDRNAGLRKWQDLYDNIDSRLEVINAMNDIVDIP